MRAGGTLNKNWNKGRRKKTHGGELPNAVNVPSRNSRGTEGLGQGVVYEVAYCDAKLSDEDHCDSQL